MWFGAAFSAILMGGHGALYDRAQGIRRPISRSPAFAPICNPVDVPWGEKAFGNYLGPDRSRWIGVGCQ